MNRPAGELSVFDWFTAIGTGVIIGVVIFGFLFLFIHWLTRMKEK